MPLSTRAARARSRLSAALVDRVIADNCVEIQRLRIRRVRVWDRGRHRYSHIRMEAKRRAVDDLSGTDFEPGVAQNWAQFFISEKADDSNSLKTRGEPGRTRTSNPLIKSQLLYH